MKTENYIREFYFILFAQRTVIQWTMAGFFAASILIAFLWPPTYAATGSVLVKAKRFEMPPEAIEQVERRTFPVEKEDLASEAQILISPDVIERTIAQLRRGPGAPQKPPLAAEVYKIQDTLETNIVPLSNVIEVVYSCGDPKQAVDVLNELMRQYALYRKSVYSPTEAATFYSQEAARFMNQLEGDERAQVDIVSKTGVADPVKEIEKNIIIKQGLQQQFHVLKNQSVEIGLRIERLDDALSRVDLQYFSFIPNKPINDMGTSLQALYVERGRLLMSYNEASDKIKLIDKHLNDVQRNLKNEVTAYKRNEMTQLKIITETIRSLEERLALIAAENVRLEQQAIDMNRITRQVQLREFSYDTFSKRSQEARISNIATANVTNVSILGKAFPSDGPVFPKKHVVIPLGIIVGLITGCSLGFLKEFFDHTFKKPSDVATFANMDVIFSIPALGEAGKPGAGGRGSVSM